MMIRVAVFAPLEEALTYLVPEELKAKIQIGHRVLVPLGRRKCVGIFIEEEKQKPSYTLKAIDTILDEKPIFSERQLELFKWASDYYLCPFGEVLRTALPAPLTRNKEEKKKKGRGKREEEKDKREKGKELRLSSTQLEIAEKILPSSSSFQIHLLHGVTGSGKTEIYFSLMQKVLAEGKSILSLVPEISLTPQLFQRYQSHFPEVTLYHSALNDTERLQAWNACREGKSKILLGTRSALFTSFDNLGLIIIDEEQDHSYKQEDRFRYHARDLAILRAKFENIPIVLGSATPSVESYYKAQTGKFIYHELTERFGGAELPKVEVVDFRENRRGGSPWPPSFGQAQGPAPTKPFHSLLSSQMINEIQKNLTNKEQTLLLLNRRGFAHFIICEDCGHTPLCPNCEITLTFHKKNTKLTCHYCDHQISPPKVCPTCMGFNFKEMGSGTEKIEEEIQNLFPEARIARMDRDSTQRKGSHGAILQKLAEGKIDILVGTQMIAKGHDYPNVTLVGILNADSSLHLPDFRASEETFQMLTQMSGRAGRAKKTGRVLLQTYSADHYSIQFAAEHRIKDFYQQELLHREELSYPPYSRLVVLRIQGTQSAKVIRGIDKLHEILFELQAKDILKADILGPSPCLMEKLRNYYRWQILLKSKGNASLQSILKRHILSTQDEWLASGLRLIIDVDPVHVI